ncbi:transposase-like protein [Candidatus Magnetobacterium bavaricum]|uniref:Transposase-like protein n=1 Tax=Candidatus Magnetobacterium bavaricum TaxID=29290 RepID=A0A0F3GNL4_9BACT|nr:transposase-like protein [Candidatus Magnetobacterium bavaricum]
MKNFLKKHLWVKLFYLASYSPEFNPIERFWKWLKSKVHGSKSFQKIDDVISKIRKFIWHYHENRLVEKINMSLEAYAELL